MSLKFLNTSASKSTLVNRWKFWWSLRPVMLKWLNTLWEGCSLSHRCLLLLMSYRRRLWVVAVVAGIVQRSPYIHTGNFVVSFACHQCQMFFNFLLLTWRECWRLIRVVTIIFIDVHGFTPFSILPSITLLICGSFGCWTQNDYIENSQKNTDTR